MSRDGDSVLVAEHHNGVVQEIRIADGSWVRFVGEDTLDRPDYVDCNADVIVVSETMCHRISVFSWADGSLLAQFGSEDSGPGQLCYPHGIRLLSDGSGLVITDVANDRLCVFSVNGEFVTAVRSDKGALSVPIDVLQCGADGGFLVGSYRTHSLTAVGRDGVIAGTYDGHGDDGVDGIDEPRALATLSDGGLIVRGHADGTRLFVFKGLSLRLAWIAVCVQQINQL